MRLHSTRRIGYLAAAAAGITLSLADNRVEAGAMYAVTNLGANSASGISDAGQVVLNGNSLYQNGVVTPLAIPNLPFKELHTVISPGGTIAYEGMASDGGYAFTTHVIRNGHDYDAGAAVPMAYGTSQSSPRAVNDSGVVVGESLALFKHDQVYVSAPGPAGTYHEVSLGPNVGFVSSATTINNVGTVAGWTDVPGQWKNHAFVGSPSHDIGTLGGQSSAATSINDNGQVVGWSNIATDWKPPANPQNYFTPEPTHAFIDQDGKMIDLGTLPGYRDSAAMAINAAGQIVGHVSNTQDAINTSTYSLTSSGVRAALFDANGGSVVDFNDLLAPNSGWILKDATAINALGQIVGWGTFDGQAQSFVLTPLSPGDTAQVPEPTSLAVVGLMMLVGAIARRRTRA